MPKYIKIRLSLFFCLGFLSIYTQSFGQQQYHAFYEVDFQQTDNLKSPLIGGLNGAQYSQMDLNKDGLLDLVVFDRSSGITHCYLGPADSYQYAPEYNNIFPADIQNFMQLKDFNNDGKADLFTAGNLGMLVYENKSTQSEFKWEKTSPFLAYESIGGNSVNLQLVYNDYPEITDIDNDGDLDIIAFQTNGLESTLIFYKNESVENTGTASMDFLVEQNNRWGDLEECFCNEFVFSGADCFSGKQKLKAQHAGGKSVFISDLNNDNILELITSHQECSNAFSFGGAGEGIDPIYTHFTSNFPNSVNPANFNYYPNTMGLLNDEGNIDKLIISPNLEAQLGISADYKSSNWLYQTDEEGNKSLLTKSFLQEDMIDWGILSSPAFKDADNDGDLDLFIAYTHTNTEGVQYSAIAFYENTGTSTTPKFTLSESNFLNFEQTEYSNLLIQFVDLNEDGMSDLAFQATLDGQNNLYVKLAEGNGQYSSESLLNSPFIGFGYSFHFADVLGSSAPDLLIGKSSGGLDLYENTSSSNSFSFSEAEKNFLNIGDDFFRSSIKVEVADLDNDNNSDLLVTDQSGYLKIYNNLKTNTGEFDSISIFNSRNNSFSRQPLGRGNTVATAALFNDDFPSIFIGSISGGLRILRNNREYSPEVNPSDNIFSVYPNPNNSGIFQVQIENSANMRIVNLNGKIVLDEITLDAGMNTIDIGKLKAGLYIFQAQITAGKILSKKIVVY